MDFKIAVLITCHNRKEKTLNCLNSFFNATYPPSYNFDIYLVDDGSSDGTKEAVIQLYPKVTLILGNGNLYWAGGMRLAWNTALQYANYDAFLLLNDDVIVFKDYFKNLLQCNQFSIETYNKSGIYALSTKDPISNKLTYGGSIVTQSFLKLKINRISPSLNVIPCHFTNANILWVSNNVVKEIGIFDKLYTHGIADYDYSYTAFKAKLPVLLAPQFGGLCTEDHGKSWKSSNNSLKERINYLYSPKGLAYPELIKFYRKHFPLYLPYIFIMLWLKTLMPIIWEKFKK